MNAPCRACEAREPGCHSKCDKYITWRSDRDRIAEKRLQMQRSTPEIPAPVIHEINKWRKKR